MVVLDTDIVIDVMNGIRPSIAAVGRLLDSSEATSISVATRMQLFQGVARTRRPAWEVRKIAHALRGTIEHVMTSEIAQTAGLLDGELAGRGERIGPFDTIIAATALHHDEPVMTRNVKHFARIPDLQIRRVEDGT